MNANKFRFIVFLACVPLNMFTVVFALRNSDWFLLGFGLFFLLYTSIGATITLRNLDKVLPNDRNPG